MPLIDDLAEVWDMDSASGTETGAHSGYVATENGGAIATTTGLIAPTARDLEAGSSQYFSVPDNADLSVGANSRTYWAWVKAETLANFPVVFGKGWSGTPDANSEFIVFYNTATSRLAATYCVTTVTFGVTADSVGALATGTWYLVVLVFDAANDLFGISVNGSTIETSELTLAVNDGTAAFVIGASPSQSIYWDGPIGQVGVSLRAFTQGEITELYNAGAGLAYDEINPPASGGSPVFIGSGFGTFFGDG